MTPRSKMGDARAESLVLERPDLSAHGKQRLLPAVERRVLAVVGVHVDAGAGDDVDHAVALLAVEREAAEQAVRLGGMAGEGDVLVGEQAVAAVRIRPARVPPLRSCTLPPPTPPFASSVTAVTS